MDFYKQYPSGLRLIAKRLDHLYTVTVGVFVDVGCVKEENETNGFSHFIEHLLFKGTKNRSSLEISETIDDIGASINAYTSKDNTCFYTKSASGDLETCIDVLTDMYLNATFPEDELERERGVILEEISMCEDAPDDVCSDLAAQALFFDQPLGQTILGKPDNIRYSTRHSIENFKKKHYIPQNTVVSVCGKFDFDVLDKLVEKYFESRFITEHTEKCDEQDVVYTSKTLHADKKTEQSHLQLAWGAYDFFSKERYSLSALASVLGGGLTSRLYQSIREKNGLAYSVFAYPSYYTKAGSFEIYAGFGPQNGVKVLNLVDQEVNKIVNDGITEQELARAKIQAVNSLYMGAENPMTLMRLYGRSLLKYNQKFNIEEDVAKHNAVTREEVNAVAREILTKKRAVAYVGSASAYKRLLPHITVG